MALTNKELKILFDIERRTLETFGDWQPHYCWLNAQRAAVIGHGLLLYHEGHLGKGAELIRHAWNSINGKVVDYSVMDWFEDKRRWAEHYKPEHTFTSYQILDILFGRNFWDWLLEAPEQRQTSRKAS